MFTCIVEGFFHFNSQSTSEKYGKLALHELKTSVDFV